MTLILFIQIKVEKITCEIHIGHQHNQRVEEQFADKIK